MVNSAKGDDVLQRVRRGPTTHAPMRQVGHLERFVPVASRPHAALVSEQGGVSEVPEFGGCGLRH
jgi:hypothetical protein